MGSIPVILWGEPSQKVYLYVHGKQSDKESAAPFALLAQERGFQTVSFDLPAHGERRGEDVPCDIFHGMENLAVMGGFVFENWASVSLYGCSLGAFFSLHAFRGHPFANCLFQSPIVDMDYLIRQMFRWFGVTEDMLREQGQIATPIDTLSWPYLQYVRDHPIESWASPTSILYGGRADLQSREVMEAFARRFHAKLTVSEQSGHPFLEAADRAVAEAWLRDNL